MKLYNYESNIYSNSGKMIHIVGNNKATIEKYFKDLNVKVGKRVNETIAKYDNVEAVLKLQKEGLQRLLKLKQCSIKEVEKCQK